MNSRKRNARTFGADPDNCKRHGGFFAYFWHELSRWWRAR